MSLLWFWLQTFPGVLFRRPLDRGLSQPGLTQAGFHCKSPKNFEKRWFQSRDKGFLSTCVLVSNLGPVRKTRQALSWHFWGTGTTGPAIFWVKGQLFVMSRWDAVHHLNKLLVFLSFFMPFLGRRGNRPCHIWGTGAIGPWPLFVMSRCDAVHHLN